MSKMEACLGGAVQGDVFDLARFEADCRRYDALMDAELRSMEAALRVRALCLLRCLLSSAKAALR